MKNLIDEKRPVTIIAVAFFLLGMSVPGFAQIDSTRTTEQAALNLMELFDNVTEIATKTKLNADYVPGMVTVLRGEDLEARGYQTVWEALELVNGIETSVSGTGLRQILIRGVGRTLGSGNIKFFLDGLPINSTFLAGAHQALEFPVELIDRIEVIRGPGSAIYGEFAFTGVINVITNKTGKKVFSRLSRFGSYNGGVSYSWDHPTHPFGVDFQIFGDITDGAEVNSGEDRLNSIGFGSISNAPGPTNEARKNYSSILKLNYKNSPLDFQYLEEGHGNHFGLSDVLPNPENRIVYKHKNGSLKARQRIDINSNSFAQFEVGWTDYRFMGDKYLIYPSGFPDFPEGMIMSNFYKENKLYSGITISLGFLDRHNFLIGSTLEFVEIKDAWIGGNYIPATLMPTTSFQRFPREENFIIVGKSRLISSLTLQDEYRSNANLTFTGGLRFDHYDDVGNSYTPRIAGVWKIQNNHLLKTQYAQAFRPPTFFEMYSKNIPSLKGNSEINPGTNDTFEIGYIYSAHQTIFRLTVFSSKLRDIIVLDENQYQNTGRVNLNGIEIEFNKDFQSIVRLNSNISFVDTDDINNKDQLEGSANWLANFGILCAPLRKTNVSMQYRYVGKRNRENPDTRKDLEGYNRIDLTGSIFYFANQGLTLRAGIKNLFDSDIKYPSKINTYPDDYPRPGRRWWMQLSYV